MSQGIWITPSTFVDFADSGREALLREIASRQTAWDFSGLIGLLPDPDPVLKKRGDSAAILDSLLADGHLTSVVQTRKLGTLKREFRWEPGAVGDQEPSARAKRLRDHLVEDLERVDLYRLLAVILDAPLYGYVPLEIMWRPGSGRMRVADIIDRPHRWFRFGDRGEPRFVAADSPWEGEELPFGKFVFARHFPTYDNPYGLRLLSRCLWPVTFKRGGVKFWVTFTEKYGMPFLFGRYPRGASKDEQEALLASLAAMVQDAVAVGPEGSAVELLGGSSGSKSSGNIYSGLVAAMDSEISKVIMGQTLTAEVSDKGGAYAQSKTHESVLADYREADQKLVKAVMEGIARIYGQVNAPGVPAPRFRWYEEEDPKKEFAERDKTLFEAGVRPGKSYFIRRYGFKEDEIETAPAAEGVPAGGGRAGEFAEPGEGFPPAQQAIEDLADASVAAASARLKSNEDLFVRVVRESGSFEEAMERLLEAWPELNTDDLAGELEQALLAAGLYGRVVVREETDGG